jgi:hypothetical protein
MFEDKVQNLKYLKIMCEELQSILHNEGHPYFYTYSNVRIINSRRL